jgi:hypothetical protein
MATTAGKFWYAVAGLAFFGAFVYGFAAGGEWVGSFILGSLSVCALLLGVLASAIHDGDVAEGTSPDVTVRSALPAGWPALTAVGGGVAIVGLAGGNALLYVGIGILGAVFLEWMVQGWAERATADPHYNAELRSRIMSPIEIPLIALLIIGVFLLSLSRVLLAVSENGSRVIAIAVATVILALAFLIAYRPRIGSSVLAGLLAVGAVALIGFGIVGGVSGEREIEKESTHESAEKTEQGNNPSADEGGEDQSSPDGTPVTQPGSDSNSTPASQP